MATIARKQLTGSTAKINQYAGHEGQLVFDTQTKHLHVLSGTAGTSTKLANVSDIPAPQDISGKADKTYVDQQLAKKQPIGDYATNAQLTQGLAGKAPNEHTHTIAEVTSLQTALDGKADTSYVDAGLAEKQPVGDYATTVALTTGLDGKLGKAEKASSATVADTANSVAWVNVTGKPTIPSSPTIYVVDAEKTSSSWYRKWSNNIIEQGGVVTSKGTNDAVNVSFLVPFKSTDFAIMVSATNLTDTNNRRYTDLIQLNTSSFTLYKSRFNGGWNQYTDVKVDWYAISSH